MIKASVFLLLSSRRDIPSVISLRNNGLQPSPRLVESRTHREEADLSTGEWGCGKGRVRKRRRSHHRAPRPERRFARLSAMPTNPVLVVHGGAWAMPDDMVEAHINGVRNALAAGWSVLERGGSSLDAVEEAVVIMEDDETFDAGRGSFLNRDGKVQLDALIMDGATLRAGGVGCVERLRNPVRASRKILTESPHVYFVGEGAERFAAEHGVALCKNEDLIIPREVERLRKYQTQAALRKSDTSD